MFGFLALQGNVGIRYRECVGILVRHRSLGEGRVIRSWGRAGRGIYFFYFVNFLAQKLSVHNETSA
jgi:hypothetical protein